jgi:hypothetical protein
MKYIKKELVAFCMAALAFAQCSKQPVNTEGTAPQLGASTEALLPHQVLNLTNWKITLPIDLDGNGVADEVKQPQLSTYSNFPYFYTAFGDAAVTFIAYVNGATTSGSYYPRSELREMKNNGSTEAKWSSNSGTHRMEIDQAVTALPIAKPHIVIGQVHDGSDDVCVFRLEGTKLWANVKGSNKQLLNSNYQLGTRFTASFLVSANKIYFYYNGVLGHTYTMSSSKSSLYFKAGAYVQSTCLNNPKKVAGESCSAAGSVNIYRVTVTHQ